MTTFDEREKSFEAKHKHDEELQFRATARRNKLLGLWAAEKLGMSGAEAEAYAKTVVSADFEAPGDEDVIAKLRADFKARGVAVLDAEIRKQLEQLLAVARSQIMKQS